MRCHCTIATTTTRHRNNAFDPLIRAVALCCEWNKVFAAATVATVAAAIVKKKKRREVPRDILLRPARKRMMTAVSKRLPNIDTNIDTEVKTRRKSRNIVLPVTPRKKAENHPARGNQSKGVIYSNCHVFGTKKVPKIA